MTSILKSLSPVVTELTVEISRDDIEKAMDKAFAQLGRTAKIRGFRKGRVPRNVLKRMFGDAVRAEVQGELVGTHLTQALQEHDLHPLSQPELDVGDAAENGSFKFTAKFENRPKMESINYDGIELEKHKIVVTDEQVATEIERIRSSLAEVTDLAEPRPAEKGDLVKVQMKHWVDGEWKDSPWPEQDFVLGENRIDKKMDEVLIGGNVGDEKVVDLGSEKEIEQNRDRFMLTIKSIQARQLPNLDDEFAKDVGDYDTLDDLKNKVRERLLKNAEQQEEGRLRHELFEALRKNNPMELPPTLVDRQTMAFQMRVQSSLAMLGNKEPEEKEREEMFERAKNAASDMVHQHLLILECARLESLEIKEEDVDASLASIAEENGLPLPMVKAEYNKEGRRDELAHSLLEKKIFDFILPKVKITEVDPPESTDGEEA